MNYQKKVCVKVEEKKIVNQLKFNLHFIIYRAIFQR